MLYFQGTQVICSYDFPTVFLDRKEYVMNESTILKGFFLLNKYTI